MWEMDHKEGWALKKWFFWTAVLEKTIESPLDSKEIKPFNPKGNQPWMFIGRTDAEAKAPILWSPDVNSQLIGKNPDAGKDWGQKEKVVTEDEMVGWHHCLNGHESEQSQGDGEGQGSLVCCSSWSQTWPPDWTTFPIINGTDAYRLLVRMLLTLWPTSFALEFLDVNITST